MDMATRQVRSVFDVSGPQEDDKRNNDLIKTSSTPPGLTKQPVNSLQLSFSTACLQILCNFHFINTYNITLFKYCYLYPEMIVPPFFPGGEKKLIHD